MHFALDVSGEAVKGGGFGQVINPSASGVQKQKLHATRRIDIFFRLRFPFCFFFGCHSY